MRDGTLRYLERLGYPQGPSRSTTPHQVGYGEHSEPEPEEVTLPAHAHETSTEPTWRETARSRVETITVKLTGYPPLKVESSNYGVYGSGAIAVLDPGHLRVTASWTGGVVKLVSARISGPLAARRADDHTTRVMPSDLESPEWPQWARDIVEEVIGMGGKEDAGTKDAREELEKLIEKQEQQGGQ